MDRAGRSVGIDRTIAAEIEQPGTASVASPVRNQAGKGLRPNVGPVAVTVFSTRPRDAEVKRLVNEAKTIASIDKRVDAFHAAQPKAADPVIIEHPIDDSLQTGDSRLLGGAMEIKSPWSDLNRK